MARPIVPLLCMAALGAAVFAASVVAEHQDGSGRASLVTAGRKLADLLEGKGGDAELRELLPKGTQVPRQTIEDLKALRSSLRAGGGIMLTRVEMPKGDPEHGRTVYQVVRGMTGGREKPATETLAWRLEAPGHWVIDPSPGR